MTERELEERESGQGNLDDIREIGYLLKILNEKLKSRANRLLKANGLTIAQMETMWYIHSHGGQAAQKDIEQFFHISHPTVTGILSRMEKNGFITSSRDPADRRVRIVHTTARADGFRALSVENKKHMEETLSKGFSEEGLEEIRQGLRRMVRNLDENRDVCEASTESCGIVSDPDENRHEADASAGSGSIMQGPGETRDEAGASAESIKEEERNSRWEQ